MLIPHTAGPWIVALHRFIEVSIGIVIGLAVTVIWPTTVASRSKKNVKNKREPNRKKFVFASGFASEIPQPSRFLGAAFDARAPRL